MWSKRSSQQIRGLVLAAAAASSSSAFAFDLDWSGQFRTEAWGVRNYAFSDGAANGGYTIQDSGAEDAYFQTLFMKLTPKIIVNDNVVVKTEWWAGDAALGMFGDSAPSLSSNRWVGGTQSRGATLTAQRFWAELLTDFGTVQLGRMPLHWGLGAVWNRGDALTARMPSTGDAARLVAKFGAFSLAPAFIKYSAGNTIGGSCEVDNTGACVSTDGLGGVTDYSMVFQYENLDEDLEGGVNFIRRIVRSQQDAASGYAGPDTTALGEAFSGSSIYNVWDIYFRKKWGKLELSAEAPIVSGSLGSFNYDSIAVASELKWQVADSFTLLARGGLAPGQGGGTAAPADFRAYSFHPDYRVGLVMFNLQPAALAAPNVRNNPALAANSVQSPFDSPLVNARYGSVGGRYDMDKWAFTGEAVFAFADQTAKAGEYFYNSRSRRYVLNGTSLDQSGFMGWELDVGAEVKWDDQLHAGVKLGYFSPGNFYAFTNTETAATLNSIVAVSATVGITF